MVVKLLKRSLNNGTYLNMFKMLRQEVDINGTGTHKYRIKRGPNKGKVL